MNNWIQGFLILLVLLTTLISTNISAQDKNNKKEELSPKERLFFGGNFIVSFSTGDAIIEVSPVIGYRVFSRLELATGPIYMYLRESDLFLTETRNTHIFGGRFYSRYHVVQDLDNILPVNINLGIFMHAEYAGISVENDFFPGNNKDGRFWDHNVLVGGGIRQPFGKNTYAFISLLYNLDEDYESIYRSPVVRFGFIF